MFELFLLSFVINREVHSTQHLSLENPPIIYLLDELFDSISDEKCRRERPACQMFLLLLRFSSVLIMLHWRLYRIHPSSWTPHGFNGSSSGSLLLFNSPPHPASPLPLLPLPSSGFVCSPRAPRCFPAQLHVPLKLLFRSDSGTLMPTASPGCEAPICRYTHTH